MWFLVPAMNYRTYLRLLPAIQLRYSCLGGVYETFGLEIIFLCFDFILRHAIFSAYMHYFRVTAIVAILPEHICTKVIVVI